MIKLSFIIPVYNVGEYISSTLDSILSNKFDFEYEIIVVNDGSTDDSQKVLASYSEKHNNILIINNSNRGVSYSRNCGIEHARGQYLTFVDGDDTINTDTYAYMLEEIENNSCDVVQCNFVTVDSKGNHIRSQFCESKKELHNIEDFYTLFFSPNKLIHNSCWGKIVSKNYISGLRFDENLTVSEDQDFVYRLLNKAKGVVLMKEVGYFYYERENSAMHTMNIDKCRNKLMVLQSFADSCDIIEVHKYINYQRAMVLIELYNLMVVKKNEQYKEIRKELIKMMTTDIYMMLSKRDKMKLLMINKANFMYRFLLRQLY